ncbi:winged-helix domain-containing protein [Halorussus amylolyticus]|uniref:winged-helix domain-containing protein n=1 Tax=Halorussus amylolyticus TaxID=1126242 RepID=UPI00192F297B|nr:winged-helix domain-containing protein [Halorussus amylolyticus]
MTGNDDTILEYLHEKDMALPPGTLHFNLEREGFEVGYSTIRRRLKLLESAGLIQNEAEEGSYYGLTEKGRQYLSGDLDASELEQDDEN